jgi:NAD(P)-dependent dehydrogenase (short-subunit alcohol dehydrogenase family)
MIDWTGQRVLITGAASGIGRALAVQLAQRGALVTAADINAEGVAETAALCDGEALVLDLADGAAGPVVVAQLVARHGRLDAVFANAGIGYRRRLLKADLDDAGLARLWEINMLGPTRLAQALCTAAEAGGWRARIVITGSENSLSLPPSVPLSALPQRSHSSPSASECPSRVAGPRQASLRSTIPPIIW